MSSFLRSLPFLGRRALAGLALVLTAPLAGAQKSVIIDHVVEDGDVYFDIEARDYPVRGLMESLCREAGLGLVGFEDVDDSPPVTVYLRHRPLHVVVEYVLGAAGLSGTLGADRLEVTALKPPFPDRERCLQAAEIGYLTALQRFPDGSEALEARERLAEIAVDRGQPEKAARHYELLAEALVDRQAQLAAHMQAGLLLVELEDWERAMPHFQLIGNTQLDKGTSLDEVELVALARRELARCILMRGESRRALYMLEGLGQVVEPLSPEDAAQRLMLFARAKIGLGEYEEALEDLDRIARGKRQYIDELEGMDLRARALEASGHPVEAAVAWLHFSRGKSKEVQREAFVRAAEVALSAEGEELGVMFLHRQAQAVGLGDALQPYLNEARSRLGLDATTFTGGTPSQRLRLAQRLASTGASEQALRKLQSLERDFRALPASQRLAYAKTYAPLLESQESVGAAVAVLREVVMTLESVENRTQLYLLAGEIYERNNQFAAAAAAYGGEL